MRPLLLAVLQNSISVLGDELQPRPRTRTIAIQGFLEGYEQACAEL
jgi:hypothetical protein